MRCVCALMGDFSKSNFFPGVSFKARYVWNILNGENNFLEGRNIYQLLRFELKVEFLWVEIKLGRLTFVSSPVVVFHVGARRAHVQHENVLTITSHAPSSNCENKTQMLLHEIPGFSCPIQNAGYVLSHSFCKCCLPLAALRLCKSQERAKQSVRVFTSAILSSVLSSLLPFCSSEIIACNSVSTLLVQESLQHQDKMNEFLFFWLLLFWCGCKLCNFKSQICYLTLLEGLQKSVNDSNFFSFSLWRRPILTLWWVVGMAFFSLLFMCVLGNFLSHTFYSTFPV